VSEKAAEAVAALLSVTVTVKVEVEWVTVGLPVMAPVEAEKESPAGRVGETLKVRVPTP
jgi:hypothetical protein